MESQNDARLNELAGTLRSIRGVTEDIYAQASDSSVIDSATSTFSSLFGSVRSSASKLGQAAKAGHPVFKLAAIILAAILVFFLVFRVF